MPGSLRLGLELPPLSARRRAADGPTAGVAEVARAAEHAGLGTLWLPGARHGGVDAGPLAGAAARVTETLGIGIVERPQWGRHPSVLAREVTALDLLSGGRAAVAVLDEGGSPDDVERLVDAASLLGRLLTEHGVTIAGRFYEVAELTLRPRPAQPGGPVVAAGWAGPPPAHGAAIDAVLDAGVSALVTGGGPAAVAATRRRLADRPATATILWRGELPADPSVAEQTLRSLFDAGADGVTALVPEAAVVGARLAGPALDAVLAALRRVAHDPSG